MCWKLEVRLPFWESKLEEASRLAERAIQARPWIDRSARNLPGRAYLEQTGERFLLHGTKPERGARGSWDLSR